MINSSFSSPSRHAVLALCLAATGAGAWAAPLSNGNFTSALAGWTASGNVSTQTLLAGPSPSGETAQALIGNSGVLPTYALGSSPALSGAALVTALGVPGGALESLKRVGDTGNVVFGSALSQTFTSGPAKLSFNWNFLSDETSNPLGNDFAFVVLDGVATRLANTFTPQSPTISVFTFESGYSPFSATLSAGSHTLSVGVVDVNDSLGSSAVLVDHVTVTPVPEPAGWTLVLAGLVALAGMVRKLPGQGRPVCAGETRVM
jgi:hypothetical protein